MSFAPDDGDRVAVIYHSRKRGLYVAVDEATGHELAAAATPEKVSYLLFEEMKAQQVKHCYLGARTEGVTSSASSSSGPATPQPHH